MAIFRHKWLIAIIPVAVLGMLLAEFFRVDAPLLAAGIRIATMAAMFLCAVLDWPSHDELAQTAHKFGWYWGSTVGMLIALAALALLDAAPGAGISISYPSMDPLEYIEWGMLATILCQFVCYLVAWGAWRVSKR